MIDDTRVKVDEQVVLSKFEGEPSPENEFERLSIHNGIVVSHDLIENGKVIGPVEDSDILGSNIGRLVSDNPEGR